MSWSSRAGGRDCIVDVMGGLSEKIMLCGISSGISPSKLGGSPLQSEGRSIITANRHRLYLAGLDCHTLLLHIEEPSVLVPELFLVSLRTILRLQLTTAIAPTENVRILLARFCLVSSPGYSHL